MANLSLGVTMITVKRVAIVGDIFIVPNPFATMDNMVRNLVGDYDGTIQGITNQIARAWINNMNKLYKLNGLEFTDSNLKDIMAEVCIVPEGIGSENLSDQGGTIFDSDGNKMYLSAPCSKIPLRFLPSDGGNFREGDKVSIRVPGNVTPWDDDGVEEVEVDLNLTLNQKGYRYSRFGNFDEVVKSLMLTV